MNAQNTNAMHVAKTVKFWTESIGSLYFLLQMLARHNFVTLSAVSRVNTATAAALDALPTQLKVSFDAGLIQTCLPGSMFGNFYYRDREDSLVRRTRAVGGREYRRYAQTHFIQKADDMGLVEWYKFKPMFVCSFGNTVSYFVYFGNHIQLALENLTLYGVLPDTIPSVFGTERGTVVNYCIEGINKHRITVRHSALSTADQRRFLYEQMRNVLFWYLLMTKMSLNE